MLELLTKGGVLIAPIIMASIVSVALVVERFMYWHRQREEVSPVEFLKAVEGGREPGECASPVARVLRAGLENRNGNPTLAMEAEAIAAGKEMTRGLPALDTIVTLAPLLGLLGTVIGMIDSFGVLSDAGLGNPLAVTGGVAEALIATAAGLTVAILTLIPYNYFLARAEKTTEDMERYATRLEMLLGRAPEAEPGGPA